MCFIVGLKSCRQLNTTTYYATLCGCPLPVGRTVKLDFTRDYICLFVELRDIWAYITLNAYRIYRICANITGIRYLFADFIEI